MVRRKGLLEFYYLDNFGIVWDYILYSLHDKIESAFPQSLNRLLK